MFKTWDLGSRLRSGILIALFAITAAFAAGTQALAPPLASAERFDCSTEPDKCGDEGSATGTPGSSSQSNGSDIWSASSTVWGSHGTDNLDWSSLPGDPEKGLLDGLGQPNLPSLDPTYVARLKKRELISPTFVRSDLRPGDLSVLTEDCYRLSAAADSLDVAVNKITGHVDRLTDHGFDVAAYYALKVLNRLRGRLSDRMDEYRLLYCGSVLSLDGRD